MAVKKQKNKTVKYLYVLTVIMIMAAVFAFAGCSGGSEEAQSEDVSGSVSEFTAQTMDGEEFGTDDLAGADLTMVNVWATWCGPCVGEMPELAQLEKELPDNVRLVTYCIDAGEERETAEEIIAEAGFEGKVISSADGDLKTLADGFQFIPTTVFLDSEGNQACEPVTGAPENPAEEYLDQINKCLETLGKDTI